MHSIPQVTGVSADPFAMPRWQGVGRSAPARDGAETFASDRRPPAPPASSTREAAAPAPRPADPERRPPDPAPRADEPAAEPAPVTPEQPAAAATDSATPPNDEASWAARVQHTATPAATADGDTSAPRAAAPAPGTAGSGTPGDRSADGLAGAQAVRPAMRPSGAAAAGTTAAAAPATAGSGAGTPRALPTPATAPPPRATPTSRSTGNPAVLAQAEAAHQSIIRSIALQARPDGGHLHLQITPPELGALDVELSVEDFKHARVTLIADRAEVATTLEQHLPDLARALAEQGLVVDEARVEVRDHDTGDGAATDPERVDPDDGMPADGAPSGLARMLRAPRTLHGSGLDLWA